MLVFSFAPPPNDSVSSQLARLQLADAEHIVIFRQALFPFSKPCRQFPGRSGWSLHSPADSTRIAVGLQRRYAGQNRHSWAGRLRNSLLQGIILF